IIISTLFILAIANWHSKSHQMAGRLRDDVYAKESSPRQTIGVKTDTVTRPPFINTGSYDF
ncbi:hypothetical protein, partial [Klebsiella oxytoca]|uniref:hypothetical protein n=1 Tax=Klebsiella oxytoca TaxID=571 RepID=UPI001D0DFB61